MLFTHLIIYFELVPLFFSSVVFTRAFLQILSSFVDRNGTVTTQKTETDAFKCGLLEEFKFYFFSLQSRILNFYNACCNHHSHKTLITSKSCRVPFSWGERHRFELLLRSQAVKLLLGHESNN